MTLWQFLTVAGLALLACSTALSLIYICLSKCAPHLDDINEDDETWDARREAVEARAREITDAA